MNEHYLRIIKIFKHIGVVRLYLNSDFINIHLGILNIISKSSNILLLFDKNFITVSAEPKNILKKISGIFSGYFSKTFKKMLSRNLYFFGIV